MKGLVLVAGLTILNLPAMGEVTTRPVTMPYLDPADPPAVMLYTQPGMTAPDLSKPFDPDSYEHHKVHVAAWMDGRVVWSRNLGKGGSPYCSGKVDPERVLEVYRILDEETSGTDHKVTSYTIPDAAMEEILVRGADGAGITWSSAHPKFTNPKLYYSSRGVSQAADFDPNAPVDDREREFRHFRRDFDTLKEAIIDLPPAEKMRFRFDWDEVQGR